MIPVTPEATTVSLWLVPSTTAPFSLSTEPRRGHPGLAAPSSDEVSVVVIEEAGVPRRILMGAISPEQMMSGDLPCWEDVAHRLMDHWGMDTAHAQEIGQFLGSRVGGGPYPAPGWSPREAWNAWTAKMRFMLSPDAGKGPACFRLPQQERVAALA